jgi:hypothetical protein
MKIIKVTLRFGYAHPVHVVVGDENPFEEAEKLIYKNHHADIILMELVSDDVINQWAQ